MSIIQPHTTGLVPCTEQQFNALVRNPSVVSNREDWRCHYTVISLRYEGCKVVIAEKHLLPNGDIRYFNDVGV